MSIPITANFTTTLTDMLRDLGLEFRIMFSALWLPIVNGHWTVNLPDNLNELPWDNPRFRLVIHAPDFIRFKQDQCLELAWLENNLNIEQQQKTLFVHWDHDLNLLYSGLIKCIEFPSHSFDLVQNLKQQYNLWKDVANKNYQYNWMCLNGRIQHHRNTVFESLKDVGNGLLTHSRYRPLPTYSYDSYDFDNVNNFVKLLPVYQSARTNIVTETLYQDYGGIITEKTLLAIAAQQPFIALGHRGIHQQLRARGFQTFDNLFDLSFDSEPYTTRLQSAINNNLSVLESTIDVSLYRDQVDHNFNWLMTGYVDSLRQRAQDQLLATL